MATIPGIQTAGGWAHPGVHHDHDSGFGEWLEQARKARGLTLDDISRETKIPRRNLEALEHGELGVMPTFYERAEVRAVARAVGIDEGLAIGRLNMAIMPCVEGLERPTQEEPAGPWLTLVSTPAFVALALVAMIAAAGIGLRVFGGTAEHATPSRSGGTVEPVAPLATPSAVVVAAEQTVATVAPAVSSVPLALPEAAPTDASPTSFNEAEIVVNTIPSGARITVNGISWGVSPVTISHMAPGAKRIRATKEGFAATEHVLTLGDGQRRTLDLHLAGAN